MRIHTDRIARSQLHRAVVTAGLAADGVWLAEVSRHGSRSHNVAFEVTLRAEDGRDRYGKRRRAPNSGSDGASPSEKAATWDEWGHWIAELFAIDPEAKIGPYDGRADFTAATRHRYYPGERTYRETAMGLCD